MTKRFNFRGASSAMTAVAAAALLAGCSLIPTYERPAAPVPTTFPSDPAQPAGPAAATVPWQDYFADPRLQGLIQTALANNRDLRVSVLNIEQARAQFQIQRSALFPAVGVSASGSRSSPNALQAFGLGGSVSSNYSVNLGITAWELDFFGRIGSLKEQALAQYLSTEESRKAAQISLIASVANGWLTLIADDELLELTRQTLDTREESVRLTKLRFDNGVVSEIDYQLANSQAENARATYAQQQRLRAQDENALALLLGAPVPAQALASGALRLDAAAPMRDLPAGLPSDLLIERPDIRAAEQQLIAANASIGAARANFFPRISLTTSVGTASSEFSNLFDKGTKAWSFAPSITLPIFNAGANQATLDAARAGQQIAVAQYEKSIQTAFSEVADALAGRATLGEQVRALRAQADAEGVRFKLSDLRYRNGIASALDLLDAQRSLFAAQQAAVQTRLLQLQNQVLLYRALGGGWTPR
ncbi:efflux transporter outer membrane subunit [Variovorax sp. LT2P21]|uniref:efflux transporter outer membrane subunit n=1 Tax=Variovorax sp. LT2P21 TaxID=3443731 RepID=UPI003F46213B